MKKKLIIALTGIMVLGVAVTVAPLTESQACTKCNQSNLDRKCGKCGSSKLFVEKFWTNNNGKLRYYFKCDSCSHDFIASATGAIITDEEVPQD